MMFGLFLVNLAVLAMTMACIDLNRRVQLLEVKLDFLHSMHDAQAQVQLKIEKELERSYRAGRPAITIDRSPRDADSYRPRAP